VVVGGGDTAIQEALFLTHFARKVTVIHRRNRLRASKILQKRAFEEKKIEFVWKAKLAEVSGQQFVTGVKVADVESGKIENIEAEGVFYLCRQSSAYRYFQGYLENGRGRLYHNR